MRKIAVLILTLALGGCWDPFASINNPVGINTLYDLEAGYYTAEQVALVYMAFPLCRTGMVSTLASPCGRRSVKLQIQQKGEATHNAVLLVRNFSKNNPTLNPITLIQNASVILASFQSVIAAAIPTQ